MSNHQTMNVRRTAVVLIIINLLLIVIVLDGTISAAGRSRGQILRGNGLEITDVNGNPRVRITTEPSGEVVFRLCDQDGTIRVKLSASESGSGLVLLNDSTELGIQLLANERGSALKLKGNGKERMVTP